ncbi:MAG: hypothetical protein QOK12_2607, partial [Mycobacterium sp.]|nr:hypothetical protein [Mycobacterium sp.]
MVDCRPAVTGEPTMSGSPVTADSRNRRSQSVFVQNQSGGDGMKRLVLDGVDLAYEDRGDGDALVFLHGMGMQIEVWQPIMDLLVA